MEEIYTFIHGIFNISKYKFAGEHLFSYVSMYLWLTNFCSISFIGFVSYTFTLSLLNQLKSEVIKHAFFNRRHII